VKQASVTVVAKRVVGLYALGGRRCKAFGAGAAKRLGKRPKQRVLEHVAEMTLGVGTAYCVDREAKRHRPAFVAGDERCVRSQPRSTVVEVGGSTPLPVACKPPKNR